LQLAQFEKLAPYIFYNPTFLGSDDVAVVSDEVAAWADWIPAHAGRYKDDRLLESTENRELRDVQVNRRALGPNTESLLRLDQANKQACSLFDISGIINSRYVVSKYVMGCHIKPHTDTDFYNTSRVFTGIYYLNENYEGGEIFFPKFSIAIRPQRGSLLLFFSEYLHGVRPITSGERYSIVWFGQATTGASPPMA
jgi:Rps23 Pro-64 3,4-dihydroxylase Tpa1-like proline 4-hydroxylase